MNIFVRTLIILLFLSTAVVFDFNSFEIRLDYILYVVLFFGLLINGKFHISKFAFLFLFIFFVFGILMSLLYEKNTEGVVVSYIAFMFLISIISSLFKNFNVKLLVNAYFISSRIAVFFGLVQLFSYFISKIIFFVDLSFLYDFSWIINTADLSYTSFSIKLTSLFTEPGYLAPFILPYLIFSFYKFRDLKNRQNRYQLLSSLLVFIFTFSLLGYISLIIYIIISQRFKVIFSFRKLFIPILVIGLTVIYIPEMFSRISDFALSDVNNVNLSTLVYIMNLDYIINSINWQIIFGYGFDSYQILMDNAVLKKLSFYDYDLLNKQYDYAWEGGGAYYEYFMLHGAPTMFFRFPVEFGLLATIYIFSKLKKKHISNIFFVGFLAFLLRSGQYLRFDFMFFVFMIIFYSNIFNIKSFKL